MVAVSTTDRAGAATARPSSGSADSLRPEIAPRETWAAGLPVTGEILAEDDVRFLLVHHTASTNDYRQDQVVAQIRRFYEFHTGQEKGWPDVAYNFFIDRFGGIWEARAGSIDGPVRGDATGGSQGFALLCSLIGDHSRVEVSPAALDGLTRLLAWLAERHGIDTTPGATVDFVSRGSSRWAPGVEVTARTISGHRDMSETACPGDFAYRLLAETIPATVTAIRSPAAQAATTTEATTVATTETRKTTAGVTIVTGSTTALAATDTETTTATATADERALAPTGNGGTGLTAVLAGAAATMVAVIAAGAVRFRRRIDR